ncbi:MAG: PaaI family thioesterase [Thermodesulfobacteriota bacterium]|jgi:acyl-CoA thioesterase FadM
MKDQEIPNYWTGQCFGCSTVNSNSLRLRFYLSENGCYTKCSIPDYLCGIDGVVHAGMIALLLDEVCQWTMIARLGKMGLTRGISVNYLKPVPTIREIVVEAKVETQDGKHAILRSTIHSKDNELLAEGECRCVMVHPSIIAKISKVDESELKEFLAKYPVEKPA